jgi:hypothetical protein
VLAAVGTLVTAPHLVRDLQHLLEPLEALGQQGVRDAEAFRLEGGTRAGGATFHGAPAPTPNITRPPVSTSSDVTALTSTPGWRYATDVTSVPSLIRRVSPPRKASVAYASGMGDSGGSPLSRIWKKWSFSPAHERHLGIRP